MSNWCQGNILSSVSTSSVAVGFDMIIACGVKQVDLDGHYLICWVEEVVQKEREEN